MLPGFNLKRKEWSRLNRLRCGQGRCNYLMFKWKIIESPMCDCSLCDQTMDHIISECPLHKFSGGLGRLSGLRRGAIDWIRNLDIMI